MISDHDDAATCRASASDSEQNHSRKSLASPSAVGAEGHEPLGVPVGHGLLVGVDVDGQVDQARLGLGFARAAAAAAARSALHHQESGAADPLHLTGHDVVARCE